MEGIDVERLTHSLGRDKTAGQGVADPVADVSRIFESIELNANRFKLPAEDIKPLQQAFLAAYLQGSAISKTDVEARMEVGRLRFASIIPSKPESEVSR